MGKSPVHDPERAPLVRRAFEEYATGRFTKERLLKQVRVCGLTNRRGRPLTSQAIGALLRNQLYAGIVDVTEYGVRGKRGDFEPLISKEVGLPRPSGSARPVSEATAPVMVRPLPHADINDAVAGALRVTIVIEDAA